MNVTLPVGTSVVDFPSDQALVLTFGDGDVIVKLRSSKVVTVNKNGVIKIKGMTPEHLHKYCASCGVPPIKGGGGGGSTAKNRTYSIKAGGDAETS